MSSAFDEPTPIALFVSKLEREKVEKCIGELDVSDSPDANGFYLWNLETKYYTCRIRILICSDVTAINPDFLSAVATVCFIVQGNESSLSDEEFDQVRSWSTLVDDCLPDLSVKLLLLHGVDASEAESLNKASSVLKWCLENDFELVEMESGNDDDDNEDKDRASDDFEDDYRCYGMRRVRDALACASWPNMELKAAKSSSRAASSLLSACSLEATGSDCKSNSSASIEEKEKEKKKKEAFIDDLLGFDDEDKLMAAVNANDDGDEASFDVLFQQLAKFREKADSLPHEERKLFAEQITLKFWSAINGDDSEIEGLDDE